MTIQKEQTVVEKKRAWFVCQTKVWEENRAAYFLKDKGFQTYLPKMEAQRIIGAKTVIMEKPLFPNYLFVRFHKETETPFIRWTKGIVKILPESIDPFSIDDEVVESLRTLTQKDGLIRKQSLKKNDRVRILQGPFKNLLGIFEEWTSDKGRVRILLDCINYHTRVNLHHTLVERVA